MKSKEIAHGTTHLKVFKCKKKRPTSYFWKVNLIELYMR